MNRLLSLLLLTAAVLLPSSAFAQATGMTTSSNQAVTGVKTFQQDKLCISGATSGSLCARTSAVAGTTPINYLTGGTVAYIGSYNYFSIEQIINGVHVGSGSPSVVNNSRVGSSALFNNTTGSGNTAMGWRASFENITGSNNSAYGMSALYYVEGSGNTGVGVSAGTYTTGGGAFLTSGSNNSIFGFRARTLNATDDNSTVIGANAIGSGSNTVTIGGSGVTGIYLPVYTSNGFLKTGGGTGLLSVDTATYENALTFSTGLNRSTNTITVNWASPGAAIGTSTPVAITGTTVSDAIGDVRLLPQNSQSTAYTFALTDCGKHVLHPSADTTARTFTINSNTNLALPIGCAITIVNQNAGGVITLAITSDTMRLAGPGTTGSRNIAANCVVTVLKIVATEWIVSGGTCLT